MVPVREPHGPPDRIAGRRPYDFGYQSAGSQAQAFPDWSASIWTQTDGTRRISSDIPMWSTRPTAIPNCTAGTISSESRADMPTAPWPCSGPFRVRGFLRARPRRVRRFPVREMVTVAAAGGDAGGYYRPIAVTGSVPCLPSQPKGLLHGSLHARGTRPLQPFLLLLR